MRVHHLTYLFIFRFSFYLVLPSTRMYFKWLDKIKREISTNTRWSRSWKGASQFVVISYFDSSDRIVIARYSGYRINLKLGYRTKFFIRLLSLLTGWKLEAIQGGQLGLFWIDDDLLWMRYKAYNRYWSAFSSGFHVLFVWFPPFIMKEADEEEQTINQVIWRPLDGGSDKVWGESKRKKKCREEGENRV